MPDVTTSPQTPKTATRRVTLGDSTYVYNPDTVMDIADHPMAQAGVDRLKAIKGREAQSSDRQNGY